MKKILLLILSILLVSCSPKYIKGLIIEPIDMKIEKKDYLDEAEKFLDRYLDSFINHKDKLLSLYMGKEIIWEVLDGNAKIEDNIIYKNEDSSEYEKISLKATWDQKEYIFDNIELIDEYVGYLMTYFIGDGLKNENLYYAFTYDGNLWYSLNKEEKILSASIGTRRLRDPSLIRKQGGSFSLVATEGYDNPDIFAFDTSNLLDFENERLLRVNKGKNMSESQAWAPEGFYDRRIDKYVIYWSSPNDKKMFLTYSEGMSTISYPEVLIDTGFEVIDGTLFKENGNYSIVLKDERKPMEEYSQLFVGYSDDDYTNIKHFNLDYFSNHQSEGPFIIERDYDYILYYDDYTRHTFKAYTFYELRSNIFEKVKDKDIISSISNLKHGSVLPITWKEFERIKERIDVGEN